MAILVSVIAQQRIAAHVWIKTESPEGCAATALT